jgi:hypothetical protein
MNPYLSITAAAALVAALGLAGNADVQEAEAHGSLYCEMVALYESSNGELGWPAYEPAINCNN